MVTALLEYLNPLAVFLLAYIELILFMAILFKYSHLCNVK